MSLFIYDTIRKKILRYKNNKFYDNKYQYICVIVNKYDCTAIKYYKNTPIIKGFDTTNHVIISPAGNNVAPFCYYINTKTGKSTFLRICRGKIVKYNRDIKCGNNLFIHGSPLVLNGRGITSASYFIIRNKVYSGNKVSFNLRNRFLNYVNSDIKFITYFINNSEYLSILTFLICVKQYRCRGINNFNTFPRYIVNYIIKKIMPH